jgi:hypothetical protein
VLVRYRIRAASSTGDDLGMMKALLAIYTKLLRLPDLRPMERAALEDGIDQYRSQEDLLLGKRALREGRRGEALERLTRANLRLRRWKLDATILGLRIAPALVYKVMNRVRPAE